MSKIPVLDSLPGQQKKSVPRAGTGIHDPQPQPRSPPATIDLRALAGAWNVLFPTKPTPHWPPSQPAAPALTVDPDQPQAPRAVMPIKNNLPRKRTRSTSPSSSKAIYGHRLGPRPSRKGNVKQAKLWAAMANKPPYSDDPVDYNDIKAWIAEQEASPTPAPLTDLQRRAITDLKNSIKASTEAKFEALVPKLEDLVGGNNWVSLLLMYRDAHLELGVSVEFHDVVRNGPPWIIHCTIQSSRRDENGQPMNREFPDRDFGFMPVPPNGVVGDLPFAKKKHAKQYAAKCCIDFLMKGGHMPTDGVNVSFPKPNLKVPPPPAKKRKVVSQGIDVRNVNRPIANTSSLSSDNPRTPPETMNDVSQSTIVPPTKAQVAETGGGGAPVDVHDAYISAVERVKEMCKRLGIQPPRYDIKQVDPTDDTRYDGSVEFGIDMQIPETIGRVVNCCGRIFAREKVADEVLEYLFQVEAKRNAAADELLQAMASREVENEL